LLHEAANGLVFSQADGSRVKLTAEVVARLRAYAQYAPDAPEAGGVLLGRYLLDSCDIVVDDLTEPLPGDSRGRCFFHRAQAAHQRIIEQAWRASGGTCTYLGEWHTHPEAYPMPSSTDRRDWRRKLRHDQYFDRLLFLIVGTSAVAGWHGSRSQLIQPLLLHHS
jgi:integrative and conjugative element protein (TIGR02256 family)